MSFVLLLSNLPAQDYRWPIDASQNLSATFCEYRNGHLHAGVDIKTWGEMEVPCLSIDDGYIERVIVHYSGYGRGLFLKTKHGHIAVYGHLESFLPEIEERVRKRQLEQDQYEVRLQFGPDEFPVKKGQRIGYSGTSGTEHPHLHFEIRDSSAMVLNPQLFFPGIKDTQAPILDEFLLLPDQSASRVNGSRQGLIVDPEANASPARIQGSVVVGVNAHDRADDTFNKYNIFQTELFLDDSLAFHQVFNELPLRLSDNVSLIYPGIRGRRGWRFMALYSHEDSAQMPFAQQDLRGIIHPDGLSRLRVRVADIQGNEDAAEILIRSQIPAQWSILHEHDQIVVVRHYPKNGYERFQFYTGTHSYIPITQTLHTVSSTRWYIPAERTRTGIQGLGALNGEIKWVIPPVQAQDSLFTMRWYQQDDQYYFRLESSGPFVFPIAYELEYPGGSFAGELVQIEHSISESDLVPLPIRATSLLLKLMIADSSMGSQALIPMVPLEPGIRYSLTKNSLGLEFEAENSGPSVVYVQCDTLMAEFSDREVVGVGIQVFGDRDHFTGVLKFHKPDSLSRYGFYRPDKKKRWRLISSQDSSEMLVKHLDRGGKFFMLEDNEAPVVTHISREKTLKTGQRIVFKIEENTGYLPALKSALSARLDDHRFFPDYNPLRQELSFHVPSDCIHGEHRFDLDVMDAAGNSRTLTHYFQVY